MNGSTRREERAITWASCSASVKGRPAARRSGVWVMSAWCRLATSSMKAAEASLRGSRSRRASRPRTAYPFGPRRNSPVATPVWSQVLRPSRISGRELQVSRQGIERNRAGGQAVQPAAAQTGRQERDAVIVAGRPAHRWQHGELAATEERDEGA